jgi:TonB family protein
MMAWQDFVQHPHIRALGWALLNFLWQGALLALVLKCMLAAMRRQTANLRYWIATVALLLMLGIPLLTFWKPHVFRPAISRSGVMLSPSKVDFETADIALRAEAKSIPETAAGQAVPRRDAASEVFRFDVWTRAASAALEISLPWFCAFWIAGGILAGIRAGGGLFLAHRLKKDAVEFAAEGRHAYLIHRSGIRTPVRLLESARVTVPTVIGWLRPAILFPTAAAALEPEQVEALLAHELAHIRRRDYLVNLFQAMVEVLLFYHPAVWWVSARIRAERECCCDDAAVGICGDLRIYVRALSEAEHRRSPSKLAVAASSAPLLHRIRRLTEMRTPQTNHLVTGSTGIFGLIVIIAAAAGSSLLAYVPVHIDSAAFTAGQTEVKIQATQPPAAEPDKKPAERKQVPPAIAKQEVSATPKPAPITVTAQIPPPIQQQKAQLEALRIQLAKLEVLLNPSHPDVIRLKRMIAEQERQLTAQNQQVRDQQKIVGTVLDQTGGVIPGVAISVIDSETREVLANAVSTENGSFEIVPPGSNFTIQFVLPGFQTQVLTRAQLGAGPLMIEMELGQVREVVTVVTGAPAAPPNPLKREPIRVGGNVQQPKLIQRADPVYPPEARDANVQGTVVVSALIDEEGRVKDPFVLSGHRLLHDAALDAVRQWGYSPALLNGEPRPIRLSITVIFKLDRIE